MNRYNELKQLLDDLQPDLIKFYEKGNKAAGTRARKILQKLKRKAQEIRIEIIELRDQNVDTWTPRVESEEDFDAGMDESAGSGGSDDWD